MKDFDLKTYLTKSTLLKEFIGKELEDRNQVLYDKLVAGSGKSDTMEGEMLRAINRIVYRYYNDGDEYMTGYGTETAGPAHSFLVNANTGVRSAMNMIFKNGTNYEETIEDALEHILSHIEAKQGKYTPNTAGDMFDFKSEFEDDTYEEEDYDDYDEDEDEFDNEEQFESLLHENELGSLGKELADAIEDKLEDKKEEINEAIDPISILSYILAGNTLVNILSKWVSKLFKKYDFGKGAAAADKIEKFTHKLEQDFKGPIKRVVGLFTKDEKTKGIVTDGLFAALLLGLGARAGVEAFNSLRSSSVVAGGISSLKAGLKGKDIVGLVKDIASAV